MESGEHLSEMQVPLQMIALGMVVLAAHLGGRLFDRLGLSDVTGNLLGGALVGPYAMHLSGLLPESLAGYDGAIGSFRFLIFVYLSVVAFGIGEELHGTRLKQVGRAATTICLIQAVLTWAAISGCFYFFTDRPVVESLLVGSIGIATAPAVTFVLMNKLRIEGRLRHMLGSIVVLDDLLEVILFSLLVQIALQQGSEGGDVFWPVFQEVSLALLLGGAVYLILSVFVRRRARPIDLAALDHGYHEDSPFLQRVVGAHPSPSSDILIVVMGAVSLGAGIAYLFHLPFLITAIFAGFLVANLHSHAIFDSLKLKNIAPILNLGFFALIGSSISLATLGSGTLFLTALYIVSRLVGKLGGTYLGCRLTGEDEMTTAVLPRLMLPQAGVAAVEAVFVGTVLGRPEISAFILPAIVFFEIVGVFLVDHALRRWREKEAEQDRDLTQARAADEPHATGSHAGQSDAARRLLSHLSRDFILLDLKGEDKGAVIQELLDYARATSDQHIDRAEALQVIGERERLEPTGIGHGFAVPHCRLMGIDSPVLVFGRHTAGVDFGSLDHEPCTLILLVLTNARYPAEHLRILAAAAHLLSDAGIRRRLNAAPDAARFLRVIKELI